MLKVLGAAMVVALAVVGGATVAHAQGEPPPISAYAALPRMQSPSISDDGTRLAYIDRQGEATTVVVRDRASGEVLASVDVGDRLVTYVFWASPDHVALQTSMLAQTPFGYGQFPLLDVIDVKSSRSFRVMGQVERRAFPIAWGWRRGTYRGDPVLYVMAAGEKSTGGYALNLYRVDLQTGRARIHENGVENLSDYLTRPDGTIVAREMYDSEDGRWRLDARTGSGWRELHSERALLDPPNVIGFGRDASTIAFSGENDDGLAVITQMDLEGESQGEPIVLPSAPNVVLRDPQGGLVGVGFYVDSQEYAFLDPAMQARWARIRGAFPGMQVSLTSHSDDYDEMIVYVEGPGESGAYYLYEAAAQRMSLLRRARPDIPAAATAVRRAVHYRAADGLDLSGYLTLPPGREAKGLPLVVLPHGGPQARDEAGFDWWAEALASRGYAVLQPNFRGSSGFGRAFIEAGHGEWGRKMQSDLLDGVRWLSDQGVVDPTRTCIVGASYGGYAALAGMTLDAGAYRCAVSVAGVSDLRGMLRFVESEGAAGRRNPSVRYWNRFMGVEGMGDESLDERSPAMLASRIEGPILLIHGRNDTVVPFAQSEVMLAAGLAAQKPVRLVPLEGENHNLSYPATRLLMLEETVAFLLEHNPPD